MRQARGYLYSSALDRNDGRFGIIASLLKPALNVGREHAASTLNVRRPPPCPKRQA